MVAEGKKPPATPAAHGLSDHAYGNAQTHVHDAGGEYDHDHDDFGPDGPLEENAIWLQDHVSLTSVGVDIGSSGTQVIFSRINLRRLGEDLSSRYFVTSRETLYQSPVELTPYASETQIDQVALGGIIDRAYAGAALAPEQVDTGAVILTGEALRRENAQAIAGTVAEHGGDFVCATAGHHMEAMLAGYGSGASALAAQSGQRLLNIDIGGGTTKLALIDKGRIVATAAFHVGGRLQVVDEAGRITRLDPAGRELARRAGFDWTLGGSASADELDRLAESMADTVLQAVLRPRGARAHALYLTEPLPEDAGAIDGVLFSGGVAEYVYDRETRDFGDLGRRFGLALRRRLDAGALPWPLLPARECIRATALGASEYSVQLSGNTLYISNPGALLPRRNLQVVKPPLELGETVETEAVALAIRRHLALFDADDGRELALAFAWRGAPAYERVAAFARGIVAALAPRVAARQPLYLILDGDLAQTLGGILREDLGVASELLVVDGVMLADFDYIDIGRVRLPSHTVPVTVKSLVFDDMAPRIHQLEPAASGGGAHSHHHHPHTHGHRHGHGDAHDHAHQHDPAPRPTAEDQRNNR